MEIKKGIGIEEGTLVVLKRQAMPTELMENPAVKELGFVKTVSPGNSFTVTTVSGDIDCDENQIVPLCTNCDIFETLVEALRARIPDVIVNLVHMNVHLQEQNVHLQKQIDSLLSSIDSISKGLMTAQETVKKHITSSHLKGPYRLSPSTVR